MEFKTRKNFIKTFNHKYTQQKDGIKNKLEFYFAEIFERLQNIWGGR